jgi:hypothetical protein
VESRKWRPLFFVAAASLYRGGQAARYLADGTKGGQAKRWVATERGPLGTLRCGGGEKSQDGPSSVRKVPRGDFPKHAPLLEVGSYLRTAGVRQQTDWLRPTNNDAEGCLEVEVW